MPPPPLAPTLWPQSRRIRSVGVGASLRPHSSCPPLEGGVKSGSARQTWTFTRACHYTSTGGESWVLTRALSLPLKHFFRNPDGNAAPRETPGNERAPPRARPATKIRTAPRTRRAESSTLTRYRCRKEAGQVMQRRFKPAENGFPGPNRP